MYLLCYNPFRPKDLKLSRSLLFPKKGLVYDYVYTYHLFGSWKRWTSLVKQIDLDEIAQVPATMYSYLIRESLVSQISRQSLLKRDKQSKVAFYNFL